MVCPRCVMAVDRLLRDLGYNIVRVELGEAIVAESLTPDQRDEVDKALSNLGFEVLQDSQTILVDAIRRAVLAWVRMKGDRPVLSDYLQRELRKDYSALSKLFSEVNGMTIERYCIMQRIEYAKELLCYGEKTAKEIAYELGYSSPAHLSSQFKQEVGQTPAQFRNDHKDSRRTPIDIL